MILDIDAGNTRIKWRVFNSSSELSAYAYDRPWRDELVRLSQQGCVRQIRVCSVRNIAFNRLLINTCIQVFGVEPIFAKVQALSFDVRPAYSDVSQLGVDRWLAMLAAYRRAPEGCVVVSLGTAITVDYIDRDGVHLGGYIVPGVSALSSSLYDNTDAIECRAIRLSDDVGPGVDTESCVRNGLSLMLRSFFDQVRHGLTGQCGVANEQAPPLFVTGGDAEMLSNLLHSWRFGDIHSAPDLIFKGLHIAVPVL